MKLFLLLSLFVVSGCSTLALGDLRTEGAKASGVCIKGGYAMAGGTVTGAKANDDFKGSIVVSPDCGVVIVSE